MFEKAFERIARVFILFGCQVGRADFAPEFMLRVRLVARYNLPEMLYSFRVFVFETADASELVMRIRFFRINRDGACETLARFNVFFAVEVYETEIVV